jgi:hypothetical protein
MIRLTPRLLIAAANAAVGMSEKSALAVKRVVERRLALEDGYVGDRELAHDVALVLHWGHCAHYDERIESSSWPITRVRTADDIAGCASRNGLLRETPLEGDLFLLFSPPSRGYVRVGIVANVCGEGRLGARSSYYDVITIEPDSNEHGELGGGKVVRMKRRLCAAAGDRFVRWADMDRRLPLQRDAMYLPSKREAISI